MNPECMLYPLKLAKIVFDFFHISDLVYFLRLHFATPCLHFIYILRRGCILIVSILLLGCLLIVSKIDLT